MNAKPIIQVGIALIFLGLAAFIHQGAGPSNRELLVAVGLGQSGTDDPKSGFLSPLTGGLVVVSGIVLVFIGIKKSD
jgi:UDP-N-acetylmuramyl pentapeptide phosphotransferase/UDP-N-acetylglucosamine-1-phosphate transferase